MDGRTSRGCRHLGIEAAKATSLRLNDAVKSFTLLFDFPVGFVVVICFDDAAAIVWFVGAFKLSIPGGCGPSATVSAMAQIGELALILLPIGGAITAAYGRCAGSCRRGRC